MLMLFHFFMMLNTYVHSNHEVFLREAVKISYCMGPILDLPDLPKPKGPDRFNDS